MPVQNNPFVGIPANCQMSLFGNFISWRDFVKTNLVSGEVCRRVGTELYRFRIADVRAKSTWANLFFPQFFCKSVDDGRTWQLVPRSSLTHFGELVDVQTVVINDSCYCIQMADRRIQIFYQRRFQLIIVPPSVTDFLLPFSEVAIPDGVTHESFGSFFYENCVPNEFAARLATETVATENSSCESSRDGLLHVLRLAPCVGAVMVKKGSNTERLAIHRLGPQGHLSIGEVKVVSSVVKDGVRTVQLLFPHAPKKVEPMENGGFRFVF